MRKEHDNVLITIITPILAILMLLLIGNPYEAGYKNPLDKISDEIKFATYGGRYEYNQAQFDYYPVEDDETDINSDSNATK